MDAYGELLARLIAELIDLLLDTLDDRTGLLRTKEIEERGRRNRANLTRERGQVMQAEVGQMKRNHHDGFICIEYTSQPDVHRRRQARTLTFNVKKELSIDRAQLITCRTIDSAGVKPRDVTQDEHTFILAGN